MCHSPGRAGPAQARAWRAGPGQGVASGAGASEAGQAGRAGPCEPGRGHGAQPCGTQDGVRFSPKARMPSCPSSEAK